MILGFQLFVACSAPSAPAPAPAATPAPAHPGSHCSAGEEVRYTCAVKGKVISVCEGAALSYRYGGLGRPELELTSTGADGKAHLARITGGGGGSQTSLRFSNAGYEYIVFSASQGELASQPGKRSSGVVVMQEGKEISRLDCSEKGERQILSVSRSVEEDRDERYNGWL
jgi:hypothetical protein